MIIVCETNEYADQEIAKMISKPYSRLKKWSLTNSEEIKQFLGLFLWMGLVRLGCLENYWSKKRIYLQAIPTSVLSRNRFQLLLSMIHFSDNATTQDSDRLAKIQPLIDILAEVGTSASRSANPQIADSSFYLQICEANFLPQIFADLR